MELLDDDIYMPISEEALPATTFDDTGDIGTDLQPSPALETNEEHNSNRQMLLLLERQGDLSEEPSTHDLTI